MNALSLSGDVRMVSDRGMEEGGTRLAAIRALLVSMSIWGSEYEQVSIEKRWALIHYICDRWREHRLLRSCVVVR